jgi:hypothetical protein
VTVTQLIFKKRVSACQLFAKDSYTEHDENPSDSFIDNTRSRMDSLHIRVVFSLNKECSEFSVATGKSVIMQPVA